MKEYLALLRDILENGEEREDRTSTGTLSVFGRQLRFDLTKGFPAVTTKKLAWKACVSELLWFIEGSNDERRLAEILHNTRDASKTTIWTANAQANYWKHKAKFDGDLGRIYGVQWRSWQTFDEAMSPIIRDEFGDCHLGKPKKIEIDQLKNLIDGIRNDPYSRRHILSAWNVGELNNMALPPCHMLCQFYVSTGGKLSCHMYQRSADVGLGLPLNISSYALLTHLIAQITELEVGDLIISIGDAHIYSDHINSLKEQLSREPLPLPKLWLNPDIKYIDDFKMKDIKLIDYKCHSKIQMNMAV